MAAVMLLFRASCVDNIVRITPNSRQHLRHSSTLAGITHQGRGTFSLVVVCGRLDSDSTVSPPPYTPSPSTAAILPTKIPAHSPVNLSSRLLLIAVERELKSHLSLCPLRGSLLLRHSVSDTLGREDCSQIREPDSTWEETKIGPFCSCVAIRTRHCDGG